MLTARSRTNFFTSTSSLFFWTITGLRESRTRKIPSIFINKIFCKLWKVRFRPCIEFRTCSITHSATRVRHMSKGLDTVGEKFSPNTTRNSESTCLCNVAHSATHLRDAEYVVSSRSESETTDAQVSLSLLPSVVVCATWPPTCL